MLEKKKFFISLSKSGINCLSLGSTPTQKLIDNEGAEKMIHSLDALAFLKPDQTNFLNYQC